MLRHRILAPVALFLIVTTVPLFELSGSADSSLSPTELVSPRQPVCSPDFLKQAEHYLSARETRSPVLVARKLRVLRLCRQSASVGDDLLLGLLPSAHGELRGELLLYIKSRHLTSALPILETLLSEHDARDPRSAGEIVKAVEVLRAQCRTEGTAAEEFLFQTCRINPHEPLLSQAAPQICSDPHPEIQLGKVLLNRKPVIYLYPERDQVVNVRLKFDGRITALYPEYNTPDGWRVLANPDGTLTAEDSGESYRYLFWEGRPRIPYTIPPGEGFVVAGDDTAVFLRKALGQLGLTPAESNEFIVYWYPLMKENRFNLISFIGTPYTQSAQLEIDPKPDTILRVFMVYRALDQSVDVRPQPLPRTERHGFTVVEWGGAELPRE